MPCRPSRRWVVTTYWVLWAVVVALYLAWPLTHLEAYAWNNDEGLYVQRAALVNAGYPIYTVTFVQKPPLFVWMLQVAFRLAGQTLAAARLTALSLTLLGFLALGAVARQLWGRWAGLACAVVFLGLLEVPVRAHAVMTDLPALAFALVALGAALSFRRSGRRIWVVLCGAACAAMLLIHPLLIYFAVPLGVVLFLPGLGRVVGGAVGKVGWRDLALLSVVAAGLVLLALMAIDLQSFLTSVVQTNVGAAGIDVAHGGRGRDWARIVEYLARGWALAWLAAVGAATLCGTPAGRCGLAVAAAWFCAALATLLLWSPLWNHYLLFLTLPLVIVAGGGLAATGRWAYGVWRTGRGGWWRVLLAALTLAGVIAFVAERCGEDMPHPVGGPEWSPERRAAVAFLKETAPGGFVAADDPLLVFVAGRMVPPPLTGAANKRIRSGGLTAGNVVEAVLRYEARSVLFATERLEQLPGLERWVAMMAVERRDFGPMRAYQLDFPSLDPQRTMSYLGDGIELCGYELSSAELRPGGVLTVTLFWRSDGSTSQDYTVFVHLSDEEGVLWAQHDGPPLMGLYPTGGWAAGLLLPDRHVLVVDPDTPAGEYRLLVGMYRWPSLERLPAFSPTGSRCPDDRVLLGPVRVRLP